MERDWEDFKRVMQMEECKSFMPSIKFAWDRESTIQYRIEQWKVTIQGLTR